MFPIFNKQTKSNISVLKKSEAGEKGSGFDRVPEHPYPLLRKCLEVYLRGIQEVLGRNLFGFYLVGSLASGDFDLDSDVDFLVVTESEVTEANTKRLQALQKKVYALDAYPAKHLEGSYISYSDLLNPDVVGKKDLRYFDNGSTTIEWSIHDNNWHVRWVLRERGITLFGEEPKTYMQPVAPNALIDEMKTAMNQHIVLFEAAISQPLNFFNSQFGQPFMVLTSCRMLHTLDTGTVQSKKAGAEWAKTIVGTEWIPLIDQAWHDRIGVRFGIKIGLRAEETILQETLQFMKYVAALMSDDF